MIFEAVELDDVAAARREVVADAPRERVRAIRRDADRHQRARHQAARVREPVLAAERQRHDAARLAHARHLVGHEREDALVEAGRDDLVVREHDAGAPRERMLDDDVDRSRLDLDEIRVGLDAPELVREQVAAREVARDVDDVRIQVLRRRRAGREDRDTSARAARPGAGAA